MANTRAVNPAATDDQHLYSPEFPFIITDEESDVIVHLQSPSRTVLHENPQQTNVPMTNFNFTNIQSIICACKETARKTLQIETKTEIEPVERTTIDECENETTNEQSVDNELDIQCFSDYSDLDSVPSIYSDDIPWQQENDHMQLMIGDSEDSRQLDTSEHTTAHQQAGNISMSPSVPSNENTQHEPRPGCSHWDNNNIDQTQPGSSHWPDPRIHIGSDQIGTGNDAEIINNTSRDRVPELELQDADFTTDRFDLIRSRVRYFLNETGISITFILNLTAFIDDEPLLIEISAELYNVFNEILQRSGS